MKNSNLPTGVTDSMLGEAYLAMVLTDTANQGLDPAEAVEAWKLGLLIFTRHKNGFNDLAYTRGIKDAAKLVEDFITPQMSEFVRRTLTGIAADIRALRDKG